MDGAVNGFLHIKAGFVFCNFGQYTSNAVVLKGRIAYSWKGAGNYITILAQGRYDPSGL